MKARVRMPFDPEMNYGGALNEEMDLLPDGDWAIFLDHDATWTTSCWHDQIEEAIRFKPEAGLFTAVANRIGPLWQRDGNPECQDLNVLGPLGEARLKIRTLLDATDTMGIGGVVMVISKEAWRAVGGFKDGMGCVDHQMMFAQRAAGRRTYVIEGLYVAHRRRTTGSRLKVPFAANCPCRGAETPPTARVSLP